MSRIRLSIVILALAGLGLWGLRSCERGPSTPEEEVEQRIAEIEQAAEDRSVETIKGFISDSYADPKRRKKQDIGMVLLHYVMAQKSVHILTQIASLDVQNGTTADITVLAGLAGRPIDNPSLLPSLQADIYRVEARLVKEVDGIWRVISAEWAPATVEDFGLTEEE